MKSFFRKQQLALFAGLISMCCSCVQIQKADKISPVVPVQEAKMIDEDSDSQIQVYVFQPTFRSFQETVKYEAIGSNISSFDQVLNKVKSRARKDGCEALVQVKFYRQAYGNGKLGSSFPKIEAIGVKYTE
jgi:hypothetical protein